VGLQEKPVFGHQGPGQAAETEDAGDAALEAAEIGVGGGGISGLTELPCPLVQLHDII